MKSKCEACNGTGINSECQRPGECGRECECDCDECDGRGFTDDGVTPEQEAADAEFERGADDWRESHFK